MFDYQKAIEGLFLALAEDAFVKTGTLTGIAAVTLMNTGAKPQQQKSWSIPEQVGNSARKTGG